MFGTPRLRRVLRCCNTHAGPRQTMIPVETDATPRSLDAICRERQVWFRGIGNAAAVALPISPVRSIDLITLPPHTAAGRLAQWISTRQPRSPPVTVAFMNMRNYVAAMDAPEAIAAFGSTDQIYPDGVGLQIAQRLMGLPSFPRVSGTEMVPMLLERIPPDSRIFLLGGSPLLATRLNRAFPERFPGLRLVGTQHGYLTSSEQTRAVARIASARPDVLLIGMGSPLQEQWLARYRSRLGVGLASEQAHSKRSCEPDKTRRGGGSGSHGNTKTPRGRNVWFGGSTERAKTGQLTLKSQDTGDLVNEVSPKPSVSLLF